MPDNTIEEIKSRLDIVDIVKEYVELNKVGSNMRALCPFHAEKTPSFFVSPSRQTWRCFGGCSEGGDMFDFIMKIEGVEFPEALRILAKKAGVKVEKRDPKKASERQKLYEICELAAKFFQKQLDGSKKGKKAKKYLIDRGISEESIEKWRLGYSPDSWQALSKFLVSKGYERERVIKAGLAIKKEEKDHSYDRFRGRIMFPIAKPSGRVVAFGGRVFEGDEKSAKYLNSPQTPLYDKSKTLYGIDKAKIEMRRRDRCILAEGYTDVIMAHQVGSENVISTSGTALTSGQLNIISRYTQNLLTAFDMDEAGSSATKKGIEAARKLDFNVEVISLPKGKDPADIIKEDPEEWKKALDDFVSVMDFYFQAAFSGRDAENPKDKKKIAKELLPLIKRIPNEIEKSHWAKELSDKLDVDEKAIVNQLKKTKLKNNKKRSNKKSGKTKTKPRKEMLEERILSLIAKNPDKLALIEDYDIFLKSTKEILEAIEKEEDGEVDEKIKEKIDYFSLKPEKGMKNPAEEIKSCIKEVKREKIKKELKDVHKKIKKAEKNKTKKELKKLTERAYKLSKKLQEHNHD